ncbi:MAG TPA: LysR family transcriptional regulator [Solirubrobacteraceae bacterium]|jgi:DNA-binding transcriptional LysR family regulator|nr:LysR family transcriptional regulator [Solirubrobacteraceae bacterium]
MRIEQIEYAAAVARFGSFRRAAEELHISQPALSETVRKLEAELGVNILDRQRTGATVSAEGRELLPHLLNVIEAAQRLRFAADEQHESSRTIRLGTVSAATSPLLTATIRAFRDTHPTTQVDVVLLQQQLLHRSLLEGGLDLGLVNYLDGDEVTPELHTVELLRGHPVVCIHSDSPLTELQTVSTADLIAQPLIAMRSGYAMHRYLNRLLGGEKPSFSFSADGAEMGKLMVAAGLGVTVLPSYSVFGDPLEQRGAITARPLADDHTGVRLVVQRRRSGTPTRATRDLHKLFTDEAVAYTAAAAQG